MQEVRVRYEGTVQGVGFRYRALKLLGPLGLAGFVRNLDDGSVELALQGERKAVEEALTLLRRRLGNLIHRERTTWSPPTEGLSGFQILPTERARP